MKKKRNILYLSLVGLMLCIGFNQAKAQSGVFILDDEEFFNSDRVPENSGFFIVEPPDHDSTYDWTPVGSGLWVLSGLGMSYLVCKSKKKKRNKKA